MNRRQFLSTTAAALAVQALGNAAQGKVPLHVSTNGYPWHTFYQREGRSWKDSLDTGLGEIAAAGLQGYEGSGESPAEVRTLGPLLQKHGLEMRSMYVNSKLHDSADARKSMDQVLALADAAKPLGCRIVVTNPSPLRWGGAESKSDQQLEEQARNLDTLGAELRKLGLTLAYHNHDAELRMGGREFHHMLAATDPQNVAFCLDAHWVFRGCGDSQVAVFDSIRLYGKRIVELHLRQSQNGIWSETFGEGDINYPLLAQKLESLEVKPLIVLEQAVEARSPKTMSAVEAHRRSVTYTREIFSAFA